MAAEKPEAIPAGSRAPKEEGYPEETMQAEPTPSDEKPKHADPEDLQKAYKSLESKLGEQGTLIGQLRQQLAAAQQAPQAQAEEEAAPDFAAQLQELVSAIEEGEIDMGEALAKQAQIVRDQTLAAASQQFAQATQEREAQLKYNQFLSDHPDFAELADSGALDALIAKDPLHTRLSAYYALKGEQQASAAYEKGKAEAAKLAAGTEQTKTVLQKPGQSARQTNIPKGRVSPEQQQQLMLDALRASRGG